MTTETLAAKLERLKGTTSKITDEQAAEIATRDAIAAEEARIAEEAAKLRQLAIDQAMDAASGGGEVEALDLGAGGFFILKAPSKAVYLAYKAKMDKNNQTATDEANLAIDCVVSHSLAPTPLREVFDLFPLAPTSIGNVGLRLAGFKLQNQAKRGR